MQVSVCWSMGEECEILFESFMILGEEKFLKVGKTTAAVGSSLPGIGRT